jgi:prepilin-type processing-associated H-X9-DG protein
MYCPKCGKENPDNAQVCSNCNSLLPSLSAMVPPAMARTSSLAIASFVLGILSFCTFYITAIPAIILGIVALVKIAHSSGRLKGNGFAIPGIVVPVVAGVFMLPLMVGITMPALVRTKHLAQRMACGTNMRNLGIAIRMYADDHDNKFPTGSKWCDLLVEHAGVDRMIYKCPGATEGPSNYAMNENVVGMGPVAKPDLVLLFETHPGWNQTGGPEILTTENHRGEGCNVVFVDSHVEFVTTQELNRLRWKPD